MTKFVFDARFTISASSREEAEVRLMEALQGVDDGEEVVFVQVEGGEEVE